MRELLKDLVVSKAIKLVNGATSDGEENLDQLIEAVIRLENYEAKEERIGKSLIQNLNLPQQPGDQFL